MLAHFDDELDVELERESSTRADQAGAISCISALNGAFRYLRFKSDSLRQKIPVLLVVPDRSEESSKTSCVLRGFSNFRGAALQVALPNHENVSLIGPGGDLPALKKTALSAVNSAAILGGVCSGAAFADANALDFKLEAAKVLENTSEFLATISFGLFAVIGVYATKVGRLPWLAILFGSVSVIANSISLYFSYRTRVELVTNLVSGTFVERDSNVVYAYTGQAICLLVGAVSAFIFVAIITVCRRRAEGND